MQTVELMNNSKLNPESFHAVRYGRAFISSHCSRDFLFGGDVMRKGSKHTEDTIKLMRKIHKGQTCPMKGKKHSEESRMKMSLIKKGKKHSKESRMKMSLIKKGVRKSNETKKKMSLAKIGKNHGIIGKRHYNWGKFIPKEQREKMSLAKIGKKLSEETKKKIGDGNRGKKLSEETKKKMRFSTIGKYVGELSPHWKGGISSEPYCPLWFDKEFKNYIKERDNYECQNPKCWKKPCYLTIHHINYIKKDCQPTNLITLCTSCNSRANANKGVWERLFTMIMIIKYKQIERRIKW